MSRYLDMQFMNHIEMAMWIIIAIVFASCSAKSSMKRFVHDVSFGFARSSVVAALADFDFRV